MSPKFSIIKLLSNLLIQLDQSYEVRDKRATQLMYTRGRSVAVVNARKRLLAL